MPIFSAVVTTLLPNQGVLVGYVIIGKAKACLSWDLIYESPRAEQAASSEAHAEVLSCVGFMLLCSLLVRSISLHHSSLSFFLREYCLVSAVAPLRNDAVVTLGGKSAVHHCQSFHVIEYFWLHLRSVMMSFWVLLWRNALTLTAFAPDRSSGFWGGHICSCVDFVVYMIVSSDKKISKKIHSSGIGRRSANSTAGAI